MTTTSMSGTDNMAGLHRSVDQLSSKAGKKYDKELPLKFLPVAAGVQKGTFVYSMFFFLNMAKP